MSKRNPTSDLNHENWDEEDEKEDAGHFKAAAEDVLKKREIRVAKRRTLGGEDKGTGGLFKSFTGFTGAGSAAAAPVFSFSSSSPATAAADPNSAHLAQLKALNQSVLRWIQSHVSASPHCVLTPVFRDYERHLADIEARHPYLEEAASPAVVGVASTAAAAAAAPPTLAMPPTFSFNFSAKSPQTQPQPPAPQPAPASAVAAKPIGYAAGTTAAFFFGKSAAAASTASGASTATAAAPAAAPPTFTFGAAPPPPTSSLFGGVGGFQLAAAAAAATAGGVSNNNNNNDEAEDEEYQPPKPETREIREPGAVFSRRCKLFYMAEDKQWRDKGVGCVHVRPAEGAGGRAQLIVRADNTLGTILLNTLVTRDTTVSVTRNNLSLACPQNPAPLAAKSEGPQPQPPPPPRLVPFLVRLKAETDARDLLAKIEQLRA